MTLDINQITTRMDWGLDVARNRVQRTQGINRFAFIPTISSSYETVWELGSTYVYPSTALAMTLTSSSGASDSGLELTVTGLDTNWRIATETVTLNGSGVATTTQTFLRINETRVSNGQSPVGNVTVSNGGVNYSYASAEFSKSFSSVYSVPLGYDAYILTGKISIAKQKEVLAKIMIRPFGGIFVAEGLVGTNGAPFTKDWIIPIHLPEKTDIEMRAKAGATTEIATSFEILLVEQ